MTKDAPPELATDALVGKYMRTAASVEWELARLVKLWDTQDPRVVHGRVRLGLARLTVDARDRATEALLRGAIDPTEKPDLDTAFDDIERFRPLRNDLAHAVVNQFGTGLMVRGSDGTTAPLMAEIINEAGSAYIWVTTVLNDVNDQIRWWLGREQRPARA